MTRYPNPLAGLVGLIARAFATLDERDSGWRRAPTIVRSRSSARHMSGTSTQRAKTASTPETQKQQASLAEEQKTPLPR